MNLKVLTLNCQTQKNAQSYGEGSYVGGLNDFLTQMFAKQYYDFILMQEFHYRTSDVLRAHFGEYEILRMPDTESNIASEIAIVYRKNFTLKDSKFFSFLSFKKWNLDWPGALGCLMGRFQIPQGELIVGSTHLNPVFHVVARSREARFLKERLIEFNVGKLPVVFGGDFNTILPGEKIRHNHIFSPEFVNVTKQSGPTVDSAYIEPVILSTKCTAFLAKFGIHMRTKVDHIYLDTKTTEENRYTCRVLGDRISDHSPLEVIVGDIAELGR